LQCLRRLRRFRGCPFESHPTAQHHQKTVASLRSALRLPCSRSLRSRDRSLTPPQPRQWSSALLRTTDSLAPSVRGLTAAHRGAPPPRSDI